MPNIAFSRTQTQEEYYKSVILPPQIFIGTEPKAELFKPASNVGPHQAGILCKPAGGLWTSSYTPDEAHLADWVRWNAVERGEEGECWLPTDESYWLLTPNLNARVLHLTTEADLERFVRRYGRNEYDTALWWPSMGGLRLPYPDFAKARREWDGIHLTEEGLEELHWSLLYGWDCESTVWLNWVFDTPAKRLGGCHCKYEKGVLCQRITNSHR